MLPGAAPTVEAIHFATIQAALDALPSTGGVVRLPAGTFELKESLRVSRGDVLIEGAGTATHLKNVNTAGEPAIRVRPGNPGRLHHKSCSKQHLFEIVVIPGGGESFRLHPQLLALLVLEQAQCHAADDGKIGVGVLFTNPTLILAERYV
jgi:hypothetical protein